MKENSIYDRKSLRQVYGSTADFNELAKDCVAFSNAQGGTIDIGIEDKETLPPASQVIPDGLATAIENKVGGKTQGVIIKAEQATAENGGQFIRLRIFRSPNTIATTSSGKIFVRIGDKSMPVGSEDIVRLAADKNCVSWEDTKSTYKWQDADKDKLEKLLGSLRTSDRVSGFVKQKNTKEMLDYFYLTDPESDCLTQLGVLFIGKQTQRGRLINPLVVQCIKYDQYGEKVNKWLWDDYTLNPYEIINDIWEKIPEWKESTEISEGLFRKNIPAYPEEVIRELLSNAIVHRPYTVRGDVFINIHPDYLEIVNPGQLPLGVTSDNILHTTKKRNEHMAHIFYALHLMEREGSGYDMMYETLLANGKAVPIVVEGDDFVSVSIKRKVLSGEVIKVMQYANQHFDVKQKQLICLGLIVMHESLTSAQLITLLHLRNSDELRSWLHPLIDKKIVIGTANRSKAKEYRVNNDILKNSKYKGRTTLIRIEKHRLKQLIYEDLSIYKTASIPEIQKRIGEEISTKKIWEQLHILMAEGKVSKSGTNRWVKYHLLS
jgi:ATP-dependent DNA helicase RecG